MKNGKRHCYAYNNDLKCPWGINENSEWNCISKNTEFDKEIVKIQNLKFSCLKKTAEKRENGCCKKITVNYNGKQYELNMKNSGKKYYEAYNIGPIYLKIF